MYWRSHKKKAVLMSSSLGTPIALDYTEALIWAFHSGALSLVLMFCLAEAVVSRARWAVQASGYLLSILLHVVMLSGLGWGLIGAWPGLFDLLFGLGASVSALLGFLGIRAWLATRLREPVLDALLRVGIWASALSCALALLFAPPISQGVQVAQASLSAPWPMWLWALTASMLCSVLCVVFTTIACVRMALSGNKLAWNMVICTTTTGPVVVILAISVLTGAQFSDASLFMAVMSHIVGTLFLVRAAWKRGRTYVYANRTLAADNRDPVTRLYMGSALVRKMDAMFVKNKRLHNRPAVIAVRMFNAEDIVRESGESGYNQVVLATLARIRRIVTPADLVGRYYGSCFIVHISGRVGPQYLRGLGLRLAAATRKPVVPRLPPSGFEHDEPIETDVGVGICWVDGIDDLTLALHDAELAAAAAQAMRSRAAVVTRTGEVPQPVERALGESRFRQSAIDRMRQQFKASVAQRGQNVSGGNPGGNDASPTRRLRPKVSAQPQHTVQDASHVSRKRPMRHS
jgi:GGDEF domain-containing protein